MQTYNRYDSFGEPKWDFQSSVEVPFPDIFPYDINDGGCRATLSRNYSYAVEVRMESSIFPPLGDNRACTWREVGMALNRPVLPARSFRNAFGKMSEIQFKSEIANRVSWPFDTNLSLLWYPLRAELGRPEYCWYLPEGYEIGDCEERELNGWHYVAGSLIEETHNDSEGVVMATAAWHSDLWLMFLNTCNSRVIVTLNNRDQARRILENNVIERYLLWGNC